MSKGPLKLAALLKDVADQPEAPATSPVSLDVLQDATPPPEKPVWSKQLPKIVASFVAVVMIGGVYVVVTSFKGANPVAPISAPEVRTQDPTKQNPVEPLPPSVDRAAFSEPVQELMQYADNLRQGRIAFAPGITGEEAAKQLGYSRLFASAYEEMILRVKVREPSQGRPRLNEVIAGFDKIIGEEQAIDQLLTRKERHAVAIAYLRALQNGDVAFPAPQALAPGPPALLVQLSSAYPDVDGNFDIHDPVFAAIYRKTRDFASLRVKNTGEVWAQEIIAEFRHLILQSSTTKENEQPSVCDQARAIAQITIVTKYCPNMQLSQIFKAAADGVAQQPTVIACQVKAADELNARLGSVTNHEISKMCHAIEQHVRAGKLTAFEVAN